MEKTRTINFEAINKQIKKEYRKEFARKAILAVLWSMVGVLSFFAVASIVMMIINCFLL